MESENVKLVYSLPEKLQGKKAKEAKEGKQPVSHEEGERRWKEEEWEGAGHDPREVQGEDDTGVPGCESPRGKPAETVEGREGWRD